MRTEQQSAGDSAPVVRPEYEPPTVNPIGNLHSVVASTTQNLTCDGPDPVGGGDHEPGTMGC